MMLSNFNHPALNSVQSCYQVGYITIFQMRCAQYSNTAMDNTSLVMCDSKSFSNEMPLFLMALRIS